MKRLLVCSVVLLLLVLFSCKKDGRRDEAAKVIKEWIGKEVQFPKDAQCCVLGNDTTTNLCAGLFDREYKVLLYVDSMGCSSCRLKLAQWKQLIEEADSLFGEKLGFLFFFQPKNRKEMEYLFKRDQFDYPVFMDMNNAIDHINHFPQPTEYQCFLLDKDNKVVLIGNPMLNPNIWKLYKKQISGDETTQQEKQTSVEADKAAYDFENIPLGETRKAVFQLTNAGNFPLIINHVSTSCGCTAAEWEKKPVEPGKTAEIKVEIKPEEIGHFEKTIEVYCNAKKSPVKLTISGVVTE